MSDWSKPTLTSLYTAFITEVGGRLDDAGKQNRSDTVVLTSPPVGLIRWNTTASRWESNTGTVAVPVWSALDSLYDINVTSATTLTTSRTFAVTGDATAAAVSFNGSGNVSLATTLATVNANTGAFGGATAVPVITVNGKGLITAVSTAALGTMAAQGAAAVAITGGAISGTALTLVQSTTAAPTAEGRVEWDTDNNLLVVGNGAASAVFAPLSPTTPVTELNRTMGSTCTWNGAVISVVYGGTGVATLSGIAFGNGTSAMTAATAAQVVAAIGATAVANATNATNASELVGGVAGSLPYQSGVGATSFTLAGTAGMVLVSGGAGVPVWTASPTFTAPALGTPASGNLANCTFPTLNQNTTGSSASCSGNATTATSLAGGLVGQIPYQSAPGVTAMLAAGTAGQLLQSNAGAAPSWVAPPKQIEQIAATVAASALTCTLTPTRLEFRATPLTSGSVNTRTVAANISVVIPSTATLGTVSAQQSRLVLLAIDNVGSVELAVVNIAGGNNLDETTLINTTAISAAATASNVIYSTTARTGVPFRVVGYVESTQATAGTWATAPSTIQGIGGQALAAMSSLGNGQKWSDLTGSRSAATIYYNTTGKPIQVNITGTVNGAGSTMQLTVGGVIVSNQLSGGSQWQSLHSAVVPAGASYRYDGNVGFTWCELR